MMRAPEKIPVKLTEEVAEFIETRPVLRQTFILHQLVDMILATCGKNKPRLREILASGTCNYNVYRYWWDGFTLDDAALDTILAEFPDPDPGRTFQPHACTWVALASAAEPIPHRLTLERASCGRRWFRRQSYWDFLMELARVKQPAYHDYSYYHHGDLYACTLDARDRALLELEAARLARRSIRQQFARARWQRMELFCPRA